MLQINQGLFKGSLLTSQLSTGITAVIYNGLMSHTVRLIRTEGREVKGAAQKEDELQVPETSGFFHTGCGRARARRALTDGIGDPCTCASVKKIPITLNYIESPPL